MATGRTLGGGRILGSGRSLSPAVAAQHSRNSSMLSPSESSISLSSQVSNSLASTEAPDLSARVSLEQPENGAAAAASSRLVCPICNEEMMTLLQLNRHLDDIHQNLEEVEQDEVKSWFKAQMNKAKKFQPLAVLNQKLRGLEVFESNEILPPPPSISSNTVQEVARPDPDEVVTRAHWQRPRPNDKCSDPTCGKRLGNTYGSVNCRKCGNLFCEEHTMYQMKLSRSAQHEPVRGFWCRVCETCYKSREGYNDHHGFERNHTDDFMSIRRRHVDKIYMETGRLEKRLTKLTQMLSDPPPELSSGGLLWPVTGMKSQLKALEQTVVAWEDDATVLHCPFCQQEFSTYTFRRHHCRLCGRVVCGDPRTGCSSEVGLTVAIPGNDHSEKGVGHRNVDVRMCKDCKHTVFSKSDFARELAHVPPDQKAYENLTQFERGIRIMLPKFQKLLMTLQDPDKPPDAAQLAEATRVRKRLMESFTQYDLAARRIRDLPTNSPTQQRLQKAIYHQANNFLHLHMLPLKSLPRVLKHASPHGLPNGKSTPPLTNGRPGGGALASVMKKSNNDIDSASTTSSVVSALESEEKVLRERLIVLEEQKFFVGEMIADANRRRKFDEAGALAQNVEDLSREIDQINGQLDQLDFAGAYSGEIGSPPPSKVLGSKAWPSLWRT